MISSEEFIRQSLDLHLFFGRIMKEHSFFLEIGFTPKDSAYTSQADAFRLSFDALIAEAISLSNGVVSPEVLQSGEVVTPYTLNAEMLSSYYTGVQIQTAITQAEAGLSGGGGVMLANPVLEQRVSFLNQRYINLLTSLIQFKTNILTNVLTCKMFTVNYPLLIDHILREAKLYLRTVQRLQTREEVDMQKEMYEQEIFWSRIMAEHSKFIRGLLDPTEEQLFTAANAFGHEFDQLNAQAKVAMDQSLSMVQITNASVNATEKIRDFNAAGTKGLIECKIKSIIIPLLGDHVLRESSHFLRLLKIFEGRKARSAQ